MIAVGKSFIRCAYGIRRLGLTRNGKGGGTKFMVKMGLNEKVEESVFKWYSHTVRIDDARIVKKLCKVNITDY